MHRRTLLAVASSVLAGVTGCITDSGDTEARSVPNASSTDADDSSTAAKTDGPETDDAPAASVSVELQTVEYVVKSYQPSPDRGIDPDDVVHEDDVPAALREALYDARDGGFETDSVSGGMLSGLDEFRSHANGTLYPYVRLDGTRYEFDPSFPTFVAELGEETLDDYDADRLLPEDAQSDVESDAVRDFVRALTAQGTHLPRTEYRRSVVPDAVEGFLDEHDYLEDYNGVSRIRTEVRHADPPHTIEIRELTDEDRWGRPVIDESELDDDVLAFFEHALESDHREQVTSSPHRRHYFTDDVPESYFDVVGERGLPYFRLDGTVYSIAAGSPEYDSVPVSVSVDDGAPGREFTVTVSPAPENADATVEDSFTLTSRGALPSVLSVTHEGERHLLDSPDYDRSRWRDAPDDPDRDWRANNQVLETADPGNEFSATYAVPDELPRGTYVSRGEFNISWSLPDQTEGEYAGYPFELFITVGSS